MYIANKLKQTSISEYLLYMWQVEDMIRANGCDIDRITTAVVDQYQLPDDQRSQLIEWYSNLVEMMHLEGVEKKGHLQINKNVLLQLADLHDRLLHAPAFPFYHAAYYKVLPFIVELRSKSGTDAPAELECCFDALYGVWMLKLQHKELSKGTAEAMEVIAKFIGMLSDYYIKDKNGELKLEDD